MRQKLNLQHLLIQAPMAGVTTPPFVAACCEAGALGFVAAGYLTKEETQMFIRQVRARTNKPFGVNVFVYEMPEIEEQVIHEARHALQPFYEELSMTDTIIPALEHPLAGQIQAILEENVSIVSFTFGIPSTDILAQLKAQNIFLMGTATTKAEALAIEAAGLDAVVLQGSEAGGHRGSFLETNAFIPLMTLLGEVAGAVSIPIIAAGGLMTKGAVKDVLDAGASAAQIGTALLVADECEISEAYKEAILTSNATDTGMMTAYTGKPARGLLNSFTKQLANAPIAPYPLQHYLTIGIRKASETNKARDYAFYLMGERAYLAKRGSVQQILSSLM